MFCPTSPSLLICTDHRCNVHLFFLDGRPVISDNCIIQGPRQKNDPFRHLSYTVNLHAVSVCISMCLCSPSEMSENQPSQVVVPRDVTDREQLGHAPKRYREGTACACTVSSQRSQSPISPHGSSTFGNFKNFEETLPKMLAMEETSSVLNP